MAIYTSKNKTRLIFPRINGPNDFSFLSYTGRLMPADNLEPVFFFPILELRNLPT